MPLIDCFPLTPAVELTTAGLAIVCPTAPEPTTILLPTNQVDELVAAIGRTR